MIPRRAILAIVALALALPLGGAESKPSVATILCYHIVQSPNDTHFSITRETFEQQMNYLASAGYNVVALSDVSDYLAGKKKTLPRNAMVVTIDDGWKCTYTEIYPVMKKLKFPFTVFVYPKFIGQSGYALNWKQIKEMSDAGVDIQSHSYSHPFLTQRRHRSWDDGQYSDWLATELAESKKVIEEKTGKKVKYLAYPYGDFDSRVVKTAGENGYEAAVTAAFGVVHSDSDPYRLRRVVIDTSMSFSDYRHYLGNATLKVATQTPANGTLYDPAQPVIAAKIDKPKQLDPTSVGMTVLSLGATPFSYNPADGTISMVVREPFKTNRQQVIVWGRDVKSGKRVEATWVFYATELPKKEPAKKEVIPPAAQPPADGTEPAVTQQRPSVPDATPPPIPSPSNRRQLP